MSTTAIIGAGPAGIETAHCLAVSGGKVMIFEVAADPLAHLRDKALLFPDFTSAEELCGVFAGKLQHPNISFYPQTAVIGMARSEGQWLLQVSGGKEYTADDVVLATGYRPFDAHRKEELGYGIYPGVITSLDLEKMLQRGRIVNAAGDLPRRVAFLQCVGSRDAKVGNHYCSKVCCITAVKQAIEARKLLPQSDIDIFYMDLRCWGQGFEEMYRSAQQEYDIHFIRGRISEAAGTFDGRLQIKAEDTLTGLPLRVNCDLLVLMIGMEPSEGTRALAAKCGVAGPYGFAKSLNRHLYDNLTDREGLYLCGACKRPMCIEDVIADARSAAVEILRKH